MWLPKAASRVTGLTIVWKDAELFVLTGSNTGEPTVTVSKLVEGSTGGFAAATSVRVAEEPEILPRLPKLQMTVTVVFALVTTLNGVGVIVLVMGRNPAGNTLVAMTLVAADGPLLVTTMV